MKLLVNLIIRTSKRSYIYAYYFSRVGGPHTIGKDTNGDGIPDVPLVYTFKESQTRVEFPLNFCPGVEFGWWEGEGLNRTRKTQWHVNPDPINMKCEGFWGIAIKEWEVIKQVSVRF